MTHLRSHPLAYVTPLAALLIFGGGCFQSIETNTTQAEVDYYEPNPFGTETKFAKDSENLTSGEWWTLEGDEEAVGREWIQSQPRENALAFALYTHDHGVLKITAQCFPLFPHEPKTVSLELKLAGQWIQADEQVVQYPGWDVQFRGPSLFK